jgi:hypothetical protein
MYITSMHLEKLSDIPADAPAREGRPNMSVKQFRDGYFCTGKPNDLPVCACSIKSGVCASCKTEVYVIRFVFSPLGTADHVCPPDIGSILPDTD